MKRGKPRHTRATSRQLVSSLRTNPPVSRTLTTPCVIEAWMPQNNTCRPGLRTWFAERQAACKTRILHPLFLQRGIAYRPPCLGSTTPFTPATPATALYHLSATTSPSPQRLILAQARRTAGLPAAWSSRHYRSLLSATIQSTLGGDFYSPLALA
jgi:hypothetical protein